jgi:hypothetical protein
MQISSVRAVPLSAISPEVAAMPGVASVLRYDELTDEMQTLRSGSVQNIRESINIYHRQRRSSRRGVLF